MHEGCVWGWSVSPPTCPAVGSAARSTVGLTSLPDAALPGCWTLPLGEIKKCILISTKVRPVKTTPLPLPSVTLASPAYFSSHK